FSNRLFCNIAIIFFRVFYKNHYTNNKADKAMTEDNHRISQNSKAWRQPRTTPTLQENYQTITIVPSWPWWRKLLAFAGPGYLVAVGYMDPGNWATDLAAGSKFNYTLLSIVMLSNLMAILLQHLAGKLGIVTGRDLAQACRDHFSPTVTMILWILCEIAICACDLAEVIGSAIALKLLFNIPLIWGVCITAFDVLVLLYFQKFNFRYIEVIVVLLMSIIAGCFWFEIAISHPDFGAIMTGLMPNTDILFNPEMLYIAIGIIGATVMPHNLYLHSSIVQTRKYADTISGKKEAIKYTTIDTTIALSLAFFVNAAILIVAAAVFYAHGYQDVNDIEEAYKLLTPLVNAPLASTLFALALLASGQNSTLTGTLAGQIVMEGFLNIRLAPWLRRLLTRSVAIVPAIICIWLYGDSSIGSLMLFSQVILSFQLAFAVIPLIMFTSDRRKMGVLTNAAWVAILAWASAFLIIGLNIKFLFDFFVN
ncbi:MAG: Nramp family divalent metal transporter, partial [Candidatus Babeliales bacterium]|nr:Nramp family divalent metal transporter [Candidatus Babeliales bacterium]